MAVAAIETDYAPNHRFVYRDGAFSVVRDPASLDDAALAERLVAAAALAPTLGEAILVLNGTLAACKRQELANQPRDAFYQALGARPAPIAQAQPDWETYCALADIPLPAAN